MKNNVKWELNPEIVARHFFKNVSAPKLQCPLGSEPPLDRPRIEPFPIKWFSQLELGINYSWLICREKRGMQLGSKVVTDLKTNRKKQFILSLARRSLGICDLLETFVQKAVLVSRPVLFVMFINLPPLLRKTEPVCCHLHLWAFVPSQGQPESFPQMWGTVQVT